MYRHVVIGLVVLGLILGATNVGFCQDWFRSLYGGSSSYSYGGFKSWNTPSSSGYSLTFPNGGKLWSSNAGSGWSIRTPSGKIWGSTYNNGTRVYGQSWRY